MLKTYRIIPLVFILLISIFVFTLIPAAPDFAQTVDQLIERIEKLEAAVFHAGQTASPGLESADSPIDGPAENDDAVEPNVNMNGPWDKSMGMRHPERPCMIVNSCGPDVRSPAQIASDPYDTNNPVSQAARGEIGELPGPNQICIIRVSPWAGGTAPVDCGKCTRFGGRTKCCYMQKGEKGYKDNNRQCFTD